MKFFLKVSEKNPANRKNCAAMISIFMIVFGLGIQGLHSSEAIVFFFGCTCNHDFEKEGHSQEIRKNPENIKSVPDCHKKENIPHVCSCKNGKMLKKLGEFLSQFIYNIDFSFSYFPAYHFEKIIVDSDSLKCILFTLRLERPPSFS